ncbi:MAG: methyltransferase domain-containing protein [Planctomycetes bacterium]|nr:methyltransferase domain-containing protein [Planctomycetota bacterium]
MEQRPTWSGATIMGGLGSDKLPYMHGVSPAEQERLEAGAKLFGGAEFLPPLHPGMSVVEVGCGTGAIAREVAAKVAPGQVIGVDREEAQLETAKRLAVDQGITNVRFLRDDAAAIDLPDNTCDAAYCRFLLEHVADPVEVVGELARVVKPGGWVCAYEWDNTLEAMYPEAPAHREVWQGIYTYQEKLGGEPRIARKLYRVFLDAGLGDIQAEARVWSVTGGEPEKLRMFVEGAREIISQTRDGLLRDKLIIPETLARADAEYELLLNTPYTYIAEGFCLAIGNVETRARSGFCVANTPTPLLPLDKGG